MRIGLLEKAAILPRRHRASYTRGMLHWDTNTIRHSPLFEALRHHGACGDVLGGNDWPALANLQAMVNACGVMSGGGQPLRLVAQSARAGAFEDRYEVRIFREGALQLRAQNWHDLFNLLVWMAFPLTKAAINARHYRALLARQTCGTLNRGPAQDALTLFDESGVIVLSDDADLLQDVRDFAWKQLFWLRRDRVQKHFHCIIFGHALYEKALQPFVGITGRAILLEGGHVLQVSPRSDRESWSWETLDARLAHRVADEASFLTTRDLAPLPLLGIPGWWPANRAEDFYDNTAYFRAGRRGRAA